MWRSMVRLPSEIIDCYHSEGDSIIGGLLAEITLVRSSIVAALTRAALADAKRITVETFGSQVILRGAARSYAERRDAERAAWSAPGVTHVDNFVTVTAAIPATA